MANRWKGNIIAADATSSNGSIYIGKADGAWGLNSQLQQKKAGLWAAAITAPAIPTIIGVSAGSQTASVAFSTGSSGMPDTSVTYLATSNPGNITVSSTTSPIAFTGLTNGVSYTFTVKATNAAGLFSTSAVSSPVTPSAPAIAALFTGSNRKLYGFAWSDADGFGNSLSGSGNETFTTSFGILGMAVSKDNSKVFLCTPDIGIVSVGLDIANGSIATKDSTNVSVAGETYRGVSVNAANSVIVAAKHYGTSPFYDAYTYTSAGINSKFSTQALTGITWGNYTAIFNHNDTYVITPSQDVWNWSNSSGWGSVRTRPTTTADCKSITCNPDSTAIAMVGRYQETFITYRFSAGLLGTVYTKPSVYNTAQTENDPYSTDWIKFNAAGNVLGIATVTSPYFYFFPFSSVSGYGTKFADPATLLPGAGSGLSFSKGDAAIYAVCDSTGNAWHAYQWNNTTGFGTKYAAPANFLTLSNVDSALAASY